MVELLVGQVATLAVQIAGDLSQRRRTQAQPSRMDLPLLDLFRQSRISGPVTAMGEGGEKDQWAQPRKNDFRKEQMALSQNKL